MFNHQKIRESFCVLQVFPSTTSTRRAKDLAERLFMETLHIENEAEVEQQACKFEHILSFEATDKICTFLGQPKTCPHGSPIPPGCCCTQARVANLQK